MKEFRKRSIIIEAIQLTRNFSDVAIKFIGKENIDSFNLGESQDDSCFIDIKTLE